MKTLYNHLSSADPKIWRYYNDSTLSLEQAFSNPAGFVTDYFNDGAKHQVVQKIADQFRNAPDRLKHSVSAFLLAAWLSNKVKIYEKLNDKGFTHAANHYVFTLFLTFLYHDYYFTKEKDLKNLNVNSIANFNSFRNTFNHKFPYSSSKLLVPTNIIKLVPYYFNYRLASHEHQGVDHGVVAAHQLYNDLIINAENNKYARTHLNFNDETKHLYKLACAAIATHNIWFPKSNHIESYIKAGMNSLIGHKPLTFSRYPLLFLLGLIDTIEPVKLSRNKDFSALNDFRFDVIKSKNSSFGFAIQFGQNSFEDDCFSKRKEDLVKWLVINVKSADNNTHTLTFK